MKMFTMRRLIGLALFTFMLGTGLAPAAEQTAQVVAEIPQSGLTVQPYLQNPALDAITIIWRTAQPALGWVEWGETAALGQKTYRVIDGLREANTPDHRIRLTGLKPGKTYHYRAGSTVITEFGPNRPVFGETFFSETRSFTLPDPAAGRVTVAILNDLHNNLPMFEALSARVRQVAPDAVFFNGDCFTNPPDQLKFLKVLTAYTAGVEAWGRPAFFIRGNHEARGGYARSIKSHFEYPENEFHFAWTLGPVRFVFLDAGEDKVDSHQEYYGLNDFTAYREAQAEWLKGEVASEEFKKATWQVLIHHIPLYGRPSRFGDGGMAASRRLWEPVLRGTGIDVAISGHTHNRIIHPAGSVENPWPVVIGGGSQLPAGVVTVLRADGKELAIEQVNAKGNKVDGITITK